MYMQLRYHIFCRSMTSKNKCINYKWKNRVLAEFRFLDKELNLFNLTTAQNMCFN